MGHHSHAPMACCDGAGHGVLNERPANALAEMGGIDEEIVQDADTASSLVDDRESENLPIGRDGNAHSTVCDRVERNPKDLRVSRQRFAVLLPHPR